MISNHPRVVFQSKLSAGILIVVGSTLDLGELYVEVIVHTFQAAIFIVVEENVVQKCRGNLTLQLPMHTCSQ